MSVCLSVYVCLCAICVFDLLFRGHPDTCSHETGSAERTLAVPDPTTRTVRTVHSHRMEAHHIWDSIQHFTAGAIGGGASVAAGQPFDTVKVKMQTFPHHFRSLSQCLFVTLRREGLLRGLYAGSIPSLYANMVENAVLFLCYEQCKRVMSWVSGGDGVLQRACAGAMAAGISTIVLCPFELLKCRLQGQQQLLDRASELKAQTVRSKM